MYETSYDFFSNLKHILLEVSLSPDKKMKNWEMKRKVHIKQLSIE